MLYNKQIALTEAFIVSPDSTSSFADAELICIGNTHLDKTFHNSYTNLIKTHCNANTAVLHEGFPAHTLISIIKKENTHTPVYGWDDMQLHSQSEKLLNHFFHAKSNADFPIQLFTAINNAFNMTKLTRLVAQRNQSLIRSITQLQLLQYQQIFIVAGQGHFEENTLKNFLKNYRYCLLYSPTEPDVTQAEIQAYYFNDADN